MTPAILRRKPDRMLEAQRRFNLIDAANGNHPEARREQCQRIIKMIDAELARRAKKREGACSA